MQLVNKEFTKDLTLVQLQASMPKKFRHNVTEDMVKFINATEGDEFRDIYKENLLGFSDVMQLGRYGMTEYLNAVKFVSYKLLGDSNTIAYAKVFPDRYQRLVDKNTPMKTISSFSTTYNKGALVHKILERTLVPVHILNMDIHQEAINIQAELMRDAKSETVRQKAAECLIMQLKAPEAAKIEIDVNYSNDSIDELRETTRALAQQQLKLIQSGAVTAQAVAHSDIIARKKPEIETEYEEVE
jgi:phosphopantetheine adenylyltransferase